MLQQTDYFYHEKKEGTLLYFNWLIINYLRLSFGNEYSLAERLHHEGLG